MLRSKIDKRFMGNLALAVVLAVSTTGPVAYASNESQRPGVVDSHSQETRRLRAVANAQADVRPSRFVATDANLESDPYLIHLEKYRQAFNLQIHEVILPQIHEFNNIPNDLKTDTIRTITKFGDVLDQRLIQFGRDYKSRFMDYNRSEEVKNRLLTGESSIKWATEISLNSIVDILNSLESEKNPRKLEKTIHEKLQMINSKVQSVEKGEVIEPTLEDTVRKITPSKTGLIRTLCSAVARMCINQDLTKIIRDVPTRPFMRYGGQTAEIVFVDAHGKEVPPAQLPKNAAVIIGMNHDHASLDGMYLQEVAKLIGIDRNMILTTKDAWPHVELLSKVGITHKDKNILFKQNKDAKEKVLEAFRKQIQGRVAFSIFPEGELPFWHTQFPLFANFGAFSIARNAAYEMRNSKPVYYVEVMSNFLRATTSKDSTPIRIEITLPELVPTNPIVGDRDAWVEKKRIAFQVKANSPERRGLMIDMIAREKISSDGRAYVVDEVRPYKKAQTLPIANKSATIIRCEGAFLAN